jgi:hypothetical protein
MLCIEITGNLQFPARYIFAFFYTTREITGILYVYTTREITGVLYVYTTREVTDVLYVYSKLSDRCR